MVFFVERSIGEKHHGHKCELHISIEGFCRASVIAASSSSLASNVLFSKNSSGYFIFKESLWLQIADFLAWFVHSHTSCALFGERQQEYQKLQNKKSSIKFTINMPILERSGELKTNNFGVNLCSFTKINGPFFFSRWSTVYCSLVQS